VKDFAPVVALGLGKTAQIFGLGDLDRAQ